VLLFHASASVLARYEEFSDEHEKKGPARDRSVLVVEETRDLTLTQFRSIRCPAVLTSVYTVQPVLLAKQNRRVRSRRLVNHDQHHCWAADGQGELFGASITTVSWKHKVRG
jgi:hypothetical protein